MVKYDSAVIYQFAERLYTQAQQVIAITAVVGLLIGGAVGNLAGFTMPSRARPTIAGAVIGILLGAYAGYRRGFALRLQAQLVLCQVATEENTRRIK